MIDPSDRRWHSSGISLQKRRIILENRLFSEKTRLEGRFGPILVSIKTCLEHRSQSQCCDRQGAQVSF
ncbi:MAG: hypothetical protein A3I66_06395 [Burkholderiales bacterium RIFCSPLOWO2_02_FULL_57_36]|nr:MAG: hypothetical protein A3I66_06395 [Burkholderiales bacterium RIFCSPLOWO2_02_FULL_57_36]